MPFVGKPLSETSEQWYGKVDLTAVLRVGTLPAGAYDGNVRAELYFDEQVPAHSNWEASALGNTGVTTEGTSVTLGYGRCRASMTGKWRGAIDYTYPDRHVTTFAPKWLWVPYDHRRSVGGSWGGPYEYEGKVGDEATFSFDLKLAFRSWGVGGARGTGVLHYPILMMHKYRVSP